MSVSCKLNLIIDKKGIKLLPFQYYNNLHFITLPVNNKIPFLKGWNLLTKTVHPTSTLQNIAVLCGKVSNISVLDFDSQQAIDIFNEVTAPKWLKSGGVKGSTMDNRWFWDKHVMLLEVGQRVSTDFSVIERLK